MFNLSDNMVKLMTLEEAIENAEFFGIGYECEDGLPAREVNAETGETILTFGGRFQSC